eukprot:4704951-Prymnesium_polylepis.1
MHAQQLLRPCQHASPRRRQCDAEVRGSHHCPSYQEQHERRARCRRIDGMAIVTHGKAVVGPWDPHRGPGCAYIDDDTSSTWAKGFSPGSRRSGATWIGSGENF